VTFEEAFNAIRTRFHEEVELSSLELSAVSYDNSPIQEAPDSGPWLRVAIIPGETFQVSLGDPGNNRHRTPGILSVQVFDDLSGGDARALSVADAIVTAFRSQTVAGVRYASPRVDRVGRLGRWWVLVVSVPFSFDSLG
jgi:hypothetical protein